MIGLRATGWEPQSLRGSLPRPLARHKPTTPWMCTVRRPRRSMGCLSLGRNLDPAADLWRFTELSPRGIGECRFRSYPSALLSVSQTDQRASSKHPVSPGCSKPQKALSTTMSQANTARSAGKVHEGLVASGQDHGFSAVTKEQDVGK